MAETTGSPARLAFDRIRTVVNLPLDVYQTQEHLRSRLLTTITPPDPDQLAEIGPNNLNDATTLLLFGVHCYMQSVSAERKDEPDLVNLHRIADALVIDPVEPEELSDVQARALELAASSSGLARAYSTVTGHEVDPGSPLSLAGAITFQTEAARAKTLLDGKKPAKRSETVFDADLHQFLTAVFHPNQTAIEPTVDEADPATAPMAAKPQPPAIQTPAVEALNQPGLTLANVTIPHEEGENGIPIYRLKPGKNTTKVVIHDRDQVYEVNWTPHIKQMMATAAGAAAGMIDQGLHPRMLAGSIVDHVGLGKLVQQFRSVHTATKYFFDAKRGAYGGYLPLLSPYELKRLVETDEESTEVTVKDPQWFNFLLAVIDYGVERDVDYFLSGADLQERADPKPFRVIVEGLSPAVEIPAPDDADEGEYPDEGEQINRADGALGVLPEAGWSIEQLQSLRDVFIADLREFNVADPKKRSRTGLHFNTFPATYEHNPEDTLQLLDAIALSYDSRLASAALYDARLPYNATLASALHILEESDKKRPKFAAEITAVKLAILRAIHSVDKTDDEIRHMAGQPLGHVVNSLESRIRQAKIQHAEE